MKAPVPERIGPVTFARFSRWIAVRCPRDLDPMLRRAGGQWEPGSKRWLVEPRRIGPVLRRLHEVSDPLFRSAGIDLDQL